MDAETKDTLKKVAEYSDAEKKILKKKMFHMTFGTLVLFGFAILLDTANGFGLISERACQNSSGRG